ncbi:hypothetical protein PENARI_c006G11403 [Penicillium arizonense]|uniref:Uncharacterized protein n=1 Tax=Penicillium arizonense TaxID=1835702 RepID=A0A1F5LMH4_PENAI|nr:hypothetical protein PENARI_c006G11403 [Penicillium arizonense]OGE54296.1 hypothetical protein PENARI_c006G11403 [Penicillium arizonense]
MEKRGSNSSLAVNSESDDVEVLGDGRVNLGMRHVWRVAQQIPLLRDQGTPEDGNVNVEPPHMNIVIQVVGSRGDIQPFVALGVALKRAGHRVRVATHETFRSFVQDVDLEFFNIGGDPKRLMAYMVKNPGLLPSMKALREGTVREKKDDIREILEGCWRSCFEPDEGEDDQDVTPFLANAIIANPPSFAHLHCAEKLGIPLHLMFTSPALIPKPEDWGTSISVSGFYFLPLASDYTPPSSLQTFLGAGSPPIYIGFGSIVIDDPKSLTLLLLEAVHLAGVRAIISAGWSGLGDLDMPPEIHMLADCPHDWIFQRVSCVVHHGGAGTTAAAIAAGKPSVVVPFFGDQPFWGNMIARAGAGPDPIPFKNLTAIRLAAAIETALTSSVQARSHLLGGIVNDEDGVEAGIRSFYKQLNLSLLQCSLTPMSAATWRIRKTNIRLGSTSSALLVDMGLLDLEKLEFYHIHVGPQDPISGMALAMLDSAGSALQGFEDIGSSVTRNFKSKPKAPGHDHRFRDSRAGVCLKGMTRISASLVRAPVHIVVALTEGLHNTPKMWGDRTVRPLDDIQDLPSGLKAGGKEMCFGPYDGVSNLGTHLVSNARDHLTYPLGGLDAEVSQWFARRYVSTMDIQLVEQGRSEYAKLSNEDRASIAHEFREATSGD